MTRGANLFTSFAGRGHHPCCHLRRVTGPAVGERRVRDRLLERGDDGPALTECHLQVGSCGPEVVREGYGVLLVEQDALLRGVDARQALLGQVDSGRLPVPVLRRDVLDRLQAKERSSLPELESEVVEEHVTRDGERLGDVDRSRLGF